MGTLSSFIAKKVFDSRKFCGRIIISFDTRCFSRRASAFECATKRPFYSRAARKRNLLGDFFLLSLLYSRATKRLSFFPGHTRRANWNIKSAHDEATTTTRAFVYHKDKKGTFLSLSLFARRKRLALFSFCSFFVILIRGRVFCESVMIRKKTNRKVFAQVCNLGFFVFCLRADA